MKHALLLLACALPFAALPASLPLLECGNDTLLGGCREEWQARQRLEARQEIVDQRTRRTEEVQVRLIAGRLTLPEAAVRLLEINTDLPPELRTPLGVFPGRCETERACRCLLSRARWGLEGDSRAGEVLARLEAQLSAYLAETQQS
jgi:hypothetical protein